MLNLLFKLVEEWEGSVSPVALHFTRIAASIKSPEQKGKAARFFLSFLQSYGYLLFAKTGADLWQMLH